MQISGRCHCGNISFKLDWQPDTVEIPARACGCSFCQKHGGVWTSCPAGELEIRVDSLDLLSRYSFGTKTADFLVCKRCGAVPAVLSEIEGRTYAVVNVNTFEDIEPAILKRSAANFEGEETGARLARRARGWIPKVRLLASSDANPGVQRTRCARR